MVSEQDGRWGQSRDLPGAVALGKKLGVLGITGLSCAAPGQCGLAGYYTAAGEDKYSVRPTVPFIASDQNGRWGAAHAVPGLARLHPGKAAVINSVPCGAPGNCAAGGYYTVPGGKRGILVTQTGGGWGQAAQVPGLTGGNSEVGIVRCWSATSCIALADDYANIRAAKSRLFAVTRS